MSSSYFCSSGSTSHCSCYHSSIGSLISPAVPSIASSWSSWSSSRPEVNLYFDVSRLGGSISEDEKHVPRENRVALDIRKESDDLSRPLMVLYVLGGTATHGDEYNIIPPQLEWESLGFAHIPSDYAGRIHHFMTEKPGDEWESPKTIKATIIPMPWYSIGSHGTDTVHLVDNRVIVTKAVFKFNLGMTTNRDAYNLGELDADAISTRITINWIRGLVLTAATEMAVQIISNALLSVLSRITAVPSGWVIDLLDVVQSVDATNCELTITYTFKGQSHTHKITGANKNYSFNNATWLRDFVTNPGLLENAIKDVGKAMSQELYDNANSYLNNKYKNHVVEWKLPEE
ncbi:MAG: hypothetical protein FWG73_06990 [Planctomycetaceae bacterium]|nr:hypothetical protein [Planctomycetaceae bacterium]